MAAGVTSVRAWENTPGMVVASTRRGLEPSELRWAAEERARGRGWQSISQRLQCNELTLRRLMGDPAALAFGDPTAEPMAPEPCAAANADLTDRDKILIAISEAQPVSLPQIRAATGVGKYDAGNIMSTLGDRNATVRSGARGQGLYRLTARGEAMAASAKARKAARHG